MGQRAKGPVQKLYAQAQSYCPPESGKTWQISALGISLAGFLTKAYSEMAMNSVPQAETTRPHTMAAEPPDERTTERDAAL